MREREGDIDASAGEGAYALAFGPYKQKGFFHVPPAPPSEVNMGIFYLALFIYAFFSYFSLFYFRFPGFYKTWRHGHLFPLNAGEYIMLISIQLGKDAQ